MAEKNLYINQIERLKESFNPKAYGKEKIELIWGVVKWIPDRDLILIIDDFIADSKWPPNRKDFLDKIGERRLTNYQQEKKKVSEGFKAGDDEVKYGIKVLSKVLEGQISIEQLSEWNKSLRAIQKSCKFCNGIGLVFARLKEKKYFRGKEVMSDNWVFRCFCPIGKEESMTYEVWGTRFNDKYEIINN